MLTENHSVFVDPDAIGDQATVGTGTMNGIFERNYVEIGSVEGYYPTFFVSDTDAATITLNSTVITLQSINYHAISSRPDGTGWTILVLEKQ